MDSYTYLKDFAQALKEDKKDRAIFLIQFMKNDINYSFENTTALDFARKFGCEEVIKKLEEEGARTFLDVKRLERNKRLCEITRNGDLNGLKYLVENFDYDVNTADDEGRVAIMEAISSKLIDTFSYLLATGANVNAKTKDGNSLLMMACSASNESMVSTLIDNGADVNAKDENDETVLIKVSKEGNLYCIKRVLNENVDVNAKDKTGKTALMYVVSNAQCLGRIEPFIEAKANFDEQDENGDTALMLAIKNSNFNDAQRLIEVGADLELKNKNGETAFMLACMQNYDMFGEVIKQLIEHGASVRIISNEGKKALDFIESGHKEEIYREMWKRMKKNVTQKAKSLFSKNRDDKNLEE